MIKFSVLNLKRLAKNSTTIRVLLIAGLFSALFFLFVLNTAPQKYNLQVGDISDVDIYAPSDIVDKSATELRRKQAEESVQPIYNLDLTVQIDIEKKIGDFFTLLNSVKNNEELDKAQKLGLLERDSNISLGNSIYNTLLDASQKDLVTLEDNIKYIINQMLSGRITEQQLNDKRSDIREFFMNLPKKSKLNEIGADIAVMVLKPNMYYDEMGTQTRRQEERDKVEDIVIRKGTLIVNKGQEVSYQQIQLLNAYGLLAESDDDKFDFQFYIGYGTIISLCLIIMGLYLRSLDRKLWDNNSTILLVSLITLMALTITMVLKNISDYLIVLPAGAMLISILVGPRVAIMSNIMMSILAGFLGGFDLPVVVIMLLTGILGAGMVSKTHHRSTFILAGLAVSLVSLLIIFSEGILRREDIYRIFYNGLYGAIGGTLSAVLTIGTLPFF